MVNNTHNNDTKCPTFQDWEERFVPYMGLNNENIVRKWFLPTFTKTCLKEIASDRQSNIYTGQRKDSYLRFDFYYGYCRVKCSGKGLYHKQPYITR